MKRSLIFFQIVIIIIGIGALAFLLWEPHIEGRNAHSTFFEIYFNDPFLVYAYIASIPFFVALYQAFKVLGYVRRNKVFSETSIKALRIIKYCAISIIGFVVIGEIIIVFSNSDDRAGGVFMGILIAFSAILMTISATMFERILQKAVKTKSVNNLTL